VGKQQLSVALGRLGGLGTITLGGSVLNGGKTERGVVKLGSRIERSVDPV
jgi:hypothetical protein